MKKELLALLAIPVLAACLYAAVPSYNSFDQTYFTTNNLIVGFRSNAIPSQVVTNMTNVTLVTSNLYVTNIYATNIYVSNIVSEDLLWTNDAAGLRPADHVSYYQIVVSNMHTYGWEGRDPEYVLVTTGSNTLDTTGFSSLLIFSEETNAASAFINLSPGLFNGQELELYNYTNSFWPGQFTLPANSQVLPFGGGYVKLRNNMDWVTTNGSGLTLRYIAPDWIEMDRSYFGNTNAPVDVVMNPTDGRVPYRLNDHEFGDSPWHDLTSIGVTNGIGFNSTNQFLWSGDDTKLALGYQAAGDRAIGSSSTAIGGYAMGNSAGSFSTAVGYRALVSSANLYNTGVGWQSGVSLQAGSYNTFLGSDSGSGWTTGNYNTAIGSGSMNGNDFVNSRTAVGYYAMRAGGGGVAVGAESAIASQAINTTIGTQAGYTLTTGAGNTLVGNQAGWTISGNKNVWVGDELQTGTSNGLDAERSVIVGYRRVPQGDPLTNITDSVFLGSITGLLTNSAVKITNAITIGNNVLPTNSNEIVIGNTNNTATFLRGGVHFSSPQEIGYSAYTQYPVGYFTNIYSTNLTSGDSDLFTVPAGKKFVVWQSSIVTTNATATTFYHQVKTNGTYYLYSSSVSVSTNVASSALSRMLFEPGEIVACNTSHTGVNIITSGVLYDSSNPLSSYRIIGLSAGDNTVLTVSSGKTFYPFIVSNNFVGGSTQWQYYNQTGGPVVIKHYIVPSGGSVSESTLVQTTTVADGANSGIFIPPLTAGTTLVLNSDSASASQMCIVVGGEY